MRYYLMILFLLFFFGSYSQVFTKDMLECNVESYYEFEIEDNEQQLINYYVESELKNCEQFKNYKKIKVYNSEIKHNYFIKSDIIINDTIHLNVIIKFTEDKQIIYVSNCKFEYHENKNNYYYVFDTTCFLKTCITNKLNY